MNLTYIKDCNRGWSTQWRGGTDCDPLTQPMSRLALKNVKPVRPDRDELFVPDPEANSIGLRPWDPLISNSGRNIMPKILWMDSGLWSGSSDWNQIKSSLSYLLDSRYQMVRKQNKYKMYVDNMIFDTMMYTWVFSN